MSSSSKQIKIGAVISYLAIAFNILSGLLYTPWMVNSIGKDQYALYTLATSIINIFLLDFGIGSAVSKFLSNYYAKGEQDEADRFMGIVYKVFFAISAVIAVALLVFYFLIDTVYAKLTPEETVVFKNLYIIVAVYSVLSFPCTTFNGVLMSNERFIEVKLCNLGQKVLNVALIVVFLLLGLGVYALVLVNAFTNTVFHLLRYIAIKKKTKQRTDIKAWSGKQARSLFDFSIWVTIMSLAQRCIFNIMPTIIAALVGSAEVTLFSLASTIESYVYSFADAINGMFLPKISRILVSEDVEKQLNSLMIKVGKFHVCTIGLILIGFVSLGRQFVGLWMGSGYETVYYCAVLIILPSIIEIPQQVAKTALLAKDVVKQQSILYVIMAIINIILSVILVPIFGAIGAASAIFVSYMFRAIAFNRLYKKHLPVKLGEYFKKTYLKWSIPAIITLVFGTAISRALPQMSLLVFAVSVVLIILVYAILVWFIDVDKTGRKNIIKSLLKK